LKRQLAFLEMFLSLGLLMTLFTSLNETEVDASWSMVEADSGIVALDDSYVELKNLPTAQRFPWDDSKGLYLINAYHNIHCLVYLEGILWIRK
jgi:hypothetical protein